MAEILKLAEELQDDDDDDDDDDDSVSLSSLESSSELQDHGNVKT
jgi:hypothetical protein